MGNLIYQSLKKYDFVIDGFDFFKKKRNNVYNKIEEIDVNKYDWLVDFSSSSISKEMTQLFLENNKNVISGTTAISEETINNFKELASEKNVKYIHRVNFAKNFCYFEQLAKEISSKMPNNVIVESHNYTKLDSPSGSALRIQRILNLKDKDVLSIRCNEPCPYHTIISSNENEKIIITHQILDKNAFVEGFLDVFLKEL